MPKDKCHFLFICAANMNRSPTAKKQCEYLGQRIRPQLSCESAGLSALSAKPVNQHIIDKSSFVFVMEDYMKDQLIQSFDVASEKIIVLDIPDIYPADDPELQALLRQKLEPYIRQL